ncbi:hypothetical protein CKA32_003967 [Geitlerinema sp. FC II]|nr:hypothetical protein [Geitlerinema sp. CS-897]PPT07829.1 hypothetical protein CKA32_003967 [Geitlerinema sp. FC II]
MFLLLPLSPSPLLKLAIATFLLSGTFNNSAIAQIQLSSEFDPDPYPVTGTSGGEQYSQDCGYISGLPNFTVTLNEEFSNLRLFVESEADVTLLVETPSERLCSDDVSERMPELSGRWVPGEYYIWVGDWGNSGDFTLYFDR